MAYQSYRSLFKVKVVIHRFGNMTLPFPITLDSLIIGIIMAIVWAFTLKVAPIHLILNMDYPVAIVIFTIATTWLISKLDPSGKFVPLYIYDLLYFLVREPKKCNPFTGEIVEKKEKTKINLASAAWCPAFIEVLGRNDLPEIIIEEKEEIELEPVPITKIEKKHRLEDLIYKNHGEEEEHEI